MRIGITGHSNLSLETVAPVTRALRAVLSGAGRPIVGVTCLARGADQLFAHAVLELGGRIEVVLPAGDYLESKVKPDNVAEFAALMSRASAVTTMPFERANRDAYLAASEHLLASVDALVAVWDGKPANGPGGTGDVVAIARRRRMPVTVVWPEGAARAD